MNDGAAVAGVDLCLRGGDTFLWGLTAGVGPFQREVVLGRATAEKVLERAGPRGGPVSVEIAWAGGDVKIDGVWVLRSGPGDDPVNTLSLLLSDGRIWWPRRPVVAEYNVRRRSGDVRLVDGEVTPLQVRRRVPDVDYVRATLKNGTTLWTAAEVLADVMRIVEPGKFTPGPVLFQDVVLDTRIRLPGPEALGVVLGLLPGVSPAPTLGGSFTTINELDGSEVAAAAALGDPASGSWGVPDTSAAIPLKGRVYFDREWEIRVDAEESGSLVTRPAVRPGREEPLAENVARVTDPTLTVNGELVQAGTWVPLLTRLLPAIQAKNDAPPAANGPLTAARLRRHTLAGMSGLLRLFVAGNPPGAVDQLWCRRLSEIQGSYRRVFRILPQWMDKVASVRAARVAVADPETGTRARADAYFDHTVKPSNLGLAAEAGGRHDLHWSVTSWAANLRDAKVAPADVTVLDEQLGIFRVDPVPDEYGFGAVVAPGTLVDPVRADPASGAKTKLLWNQTSLAEPWQLSVVLSMTQASPADRTRMHAEEVSLEQALRLLPGARAPKAAGPDYDLLCSDVTVKSAWRDEDRAAILEAFWTGKAQPPGLVINLETVKAAAVAQLARAVAPLLPRGRGEFRVGLRAGVAPTGNMKIVTYGISVGQGGAGAVAWVQATMPGTTTSPSLMSLLPERVRRSLARVATIE